MVDEVAVPVGGEECDRLDLGREVDAVDDDAAVGGSECLLEDLDRILRAFFIASPFARVPLVSA